MMRTIARYVGWYLVISFGIWWGLLVVFGVGHTDVKASPLYLDWEVEEYIAFVVLPQVALLWPLFSLLMYYFCSWAGLFADSFTKGKA